MNDHLDRPEPGRPPADAATHKAPGENSSVAGRESGGGLVAVATYSSYAEAERAVDYLSDQQFPVQRTAIAGRGLSTMEQVTGRLTTWRAAGHAALTGAVIGALFGWLFGLLDWINPLITGVLLALYGAIIGAVLGGLVGMLAHGLTNGRRDFSSESSLKAERYEILVDTAVADEAGRLLDAPGGPGRTGAQLP